MTTHQNHDILYQNNDIEYRKGDSLNLKTLREKKFLTQIELADRSGLAQSTIHYLETRKQSPTERTLKKLAVALDVEVTELIQPLETEAARP